MKRLTWGSTLVWATLLAAGCQPSASSSAGGDSPGLADASATKRTARAEDASTIVGQGSATDARPTPNGSALEGDRATPGPSAAAGGGAVPGSPSGHPTNEANEANATSATSAMGATRVREATFDDLQFEMELGGEFQRSMLTPQIEDMLGQRIRIRGYILPTLRKKGLRQFVLVRDNMECCFGPGAALYDCILITMAPGETATYTIRPVAVEGVFDFEQHAPLGETLAIFKMTADAVQ